MLDREKQELILQLRKSNPVDYAILITLNGTKEKEDFLNALFNNALDKEFNKKLALHLINLSELEGIEKEKFLKDIADRITAAEKSRVDDIIQQATHQAQKELDKLREKNTDISDEVKTKIDLLTSNITTLEEKLEKATTTLETAQAGMTVVNQKLNTLMPGVTVPSLNVILNLVTNNGALSLTSEQMTGSAMGYYQIVASLRSMATGKSSQFENHSKEIENQVAIGVNLNLDVESVTNLRDQLAAEREKLKVYEEAVKSPRQQKGNIGTKK